MSVALDVFGDTWSLLIVRDLMVRGYRTFKEFHEAGEHPGRSVTKARNGRIIVSERVENDGRRVNYRLTEKGIDLAPALLELVTWGARHEKTEAPCAVIENMEKHRAELLAEVRRRWKERDHTPLLPKSGQWQWKQPERSRQTLRRSK